MLSVQHMPPVFTESLADDVNKLAESLTRENGGASQPSAPAPDAANDEDPVDEHEPTGVGV